MASCELPCSYLAWSFSVKCICSSTVSLCASHCHYFLLNFQCWKLEKLKTYSVFWQLSSSVPKVGFLLGFQTSPLKACSPTPWVLSWAGSSCPPISDWGVPSEIRQASSRDLCMGSLWSLAASASLALLFSLPLVWSMLFMELLIFHNGCALKTTQLLNVSRGFLFVNGFLIPFCSAQTVPVSHDSSSSLCRSVLNCLLSKQTHSRRIFQYT